MRGVSVAWGAGILLAGCVAVAQTGTTGTAPSSSAATTQAPATQAPAAAPLAVGELRVMASALMQAPPDAMKRLAEMLKQYHGPD